MLVVDCQIHNIPLDLAIQQSKRIWQSSKANGSATPHLKFGVGVQQSKRLFRLERTPPTI
jgi:hypothetical protein